VVEEKSAQKKEELEKETKENNHKIIIYARDSSNKKIEFMDFFYPIMCNKFVLIHFTKSRIFR
tara:strand:+ start:61 stop:249 length:189 start_codon:yes stop_codon:yes gene_type:complete